MGFLARALRTLFHRRPRRTPDAELLAVAIAVGVTRPFPHTNDLES